MALYKIVTASTRKPDYFGFSTEITPKSLLDSISLQIARTRECIYYPTLTKIIHYHSRFLRERDENTLGKKTQEGFKQILLKMHLVGGRKYILSKMHLDLDFFSQLKSKLQELEQVLSRFHSLLEAEIQKIKSCVKEQVKVLTISQKAQAEILKKELIEKEIERLPFYVMQEKFQIADEFLQGYEQMQRDFVQMQNDFIYEAHGVVGQARSQQGMYDVVIMVYAYLGYFHHAARVYLNFVKIDSGRTTACFFTTHKEKMLPKFSASLTPGKYRDTFIKILDESSLHILQTQPSRVGQSTSLHDSVAIDFNEYVKCIVEKTRKLMELYSINSEFVDKLQLCKIDLSFDESKIAQDAIGLAARTALQAAAEAIASDRAARTAPQSTAVGIASQQKTKRRLEVRFDLDLPPLDLPIQIPPGDSQIHKMEIRTRRHDAAVGRAHDSIDQNRERMRDLSRWIRHRPWNELFTSEILENEIPIIIHSLRNWLPEHAFGQRVQASSLVKTVIEYENRWNREVSGREPRRDEYGRLSEYQDRIGEEERFSYALDHMQSVSLVLFDILYNLKKSQAFTITGEELRLHSQLQST